MPVRAATAAIWAASTAKPGRIIGRAAIRRGMCASGGDGALEDGW
jgi:hypothetical protein